MSSAVTTVLLVRHGETAWNLQHRLQGQCEEDPPLNATGKQQAQALAERLSTEPVAAIYCSDLQRTVQTAQTVSDKLQGHQIVPVKELRERHLGVLEGLTRSQAALQYPNDFANLSGAPGAKPQGGESQSEVGARVISSVERIACQHPGQTILLVLHGGVLHACHRHAVGHEFKGKSINCAINVVKIEDQKWAVISWNDAKHLSNTGFMASAFGGGGEGG
ncbi:hypothetical protein ABBQ32_008150 [Trebouxia sp. C0010 RCD-2024]